MDPDAEVLIARFQMRPIPVEGGWFCETWRSPTTIRAGSVPGYHTDKPAGTAILALFCDGPDGFSALHRLATPEIWTFCAGDAFSLLLLHADRTSQVVVLGDLAAGHDVQVAVPSGTWMGGRVVAGGRFTLVGCTMAPGFTEDDFEAAVWDDLVAIYPDRAAEIARLVRY